VSRVLVLGWGNPSRGDDALGPELVRRLEALAEARTQWREHAFLTDFQLHPEHALDLAQRDLVLFADASIEAGAPFSLLPLAPAQDRSFTSHAMSPSAVLAVFHRMFERKPPDAYLLAIRGEAFELGEPMSASAGRHLEAALELAVRVLDEPDAIHSLARTAASA
jgi:hydrogenase maturation protease